MDSTLHNKYSQLEDKLHVLQGQYQQLTEDHRELRTQYARLSAETMRLQSRLSQHNQTQQIISESHLRMRERLPQIDRNPCYDWITPNMAIGDYDSDYSAFDIIYDLNFQGECVALGNSLRHHDIRTVTHHAQKQITQIAIYDQPSEKEFMKQVLHSIIPILVQRVKQLPTLKILFHCYAGVSRSASLGIAYMALMESRPYDVALQRVQEMRSQVNPNAGFVEAIKEFLNEISSTQNMIIV